MTKHGLSRDAYYNGRYDDRPAATESIYGDDVRLSCYGVQKVKNILISHKDLALLDIGGGDGSLTFELVKLLGKDIVKSATVTDISQRGLELARKRGLDAVLVDTATELPLPSESFNLVCSFHVLEHIREDDLAIKEMARVLKPSGFCYIVTPNRLGKLYPPFMLSNIVPLYILRDHVRSGYDINQLKTKCSAHGLELLEWGYYGFFGSFFEFLIKVPLFVLLKLVKVSPAHRERFFAFLHKYIFPIFVKLDRLSSEKNSHGSGVYALFRKGG